MKEKKETFNEVAVMYDQVRNRYPEQMFEEMFRLTGCGAHTHILEIASGTGIATLPLAERGCRVTGVELGEHMARVARDKLASFPNVDIQVAPFEEWEPLSGELYDLIVVATAFHWLDPKVRYEKTASLLRPGGYLAIIRYHHVAGGDSRFFEQVQICYERYRPDTVPGFRLPEASSLQPDIGGFAASGLFNSPIVWGVESEEVYTRKRYLDLLSTYSDHRIMEEADRKRLFDCIGTIMDREYDGQIRKRYWNELILARKR